jgi:arabinoxylan arabinofuranohydrolase
MSNNAGIKTTQYGETAKKYGSGEMVITGIQDGAWTSLSGVDFTNDGALTINVKALGDGHGKIKICLDLPSGTEVATVDIDVESKEPEIFSSEIEEQIIGKHDVYFVFEGEGYQVYSWEFIK